MRAGWIGLGKVGLPCALALAVLGDCEVTGYDRSDLPWRIMYGQAPQPREEGIAGLLDDPLMRRISRADSAAGVVEAADVIIIAVQTPHLPGYGGEQPAPGPPRDYEYGWLAAAVREVAAAAAGQRRHVTAVVLSTTLPGTMNRVIRPLGNAFTTFVYSPAFISLGTTARDFCHPEFVIAGADRPADAGPLLRLYGPLHSAPPVHCDFTTGELIKVAANAWATAQITFAGWIAELAHRTGADADQVLGGLRDAGGLMGPGARLRAGMGDGGPCRPRDLQALSWLARQAGMSSDFAADLIAAREAHAAWIASIARDQAALTGLPIAIMGKAYKPGTSLEDGSPGLLLRHCLRDQEARVTHWGLREDGTPWIPWSSIKSPRPLPSVCVIATAHPEYAAVTWPAGSVIIDPWGYIPDAEDITVIRPGRR